jgi:hypothetical protein
VTDPTRDPDPDAWLPGQNAPTTLITPESKQLLDNYYRNLQSALDHGDTDTRLGFLNDVLSTAVEHYGYGPWLDPDEYEPGTPTTPGYAVFTLDKHYRDPSDPEDATPYRIDHDALEKGFQLMRRRAGLTNTMAPHGWVADILQADVLNDAGIMDVVDALNIVEVALFGEVRYS